MLVELLNNDENSVTLGVLRLLLICVSIAHTHTHSHTLTHKHKTHTNTHKHTQTHTNTLSRIRTRIRAQFNSVDTASDWPGVRRNVRLRSRILYLASGFTVSEIGGYDFLNLCRKGQEMEQEAVPDNFQLSFRTWTALPSDSVERTAGQHVFPIYEICNDKMTCFFNRCGRRHLSLSLSLSTAGQ